MISNENLKVSALALQWQNHWFEPPWELMIILLGVHWFPTVTLASTVQKHAGLGWSDPLSWLYVWLYVGLCGCSCPCDGPANCPGSTSPSPHDCCDWIHSDVTPCSVTHVTEISSQQAFSAQTPLVSYLKENRNHVVHGPERQTVPVNDWTDSDMLHMRHLLSFNNIWYIYNKSKFQAVQVNGTPLTPPVLWHVIEKLITVNWIYFFHLNLHFLKHLNNTIKLFITGGPWLTLEFSS